MADTSKDSRLVLRIELEPIDTLFFRDARPFEATSRAASGLPMPQTLAGAIRTTTIEAHGVDPAQIGNRMNEGVAFREALGGFGSAVKGIADVSVSGPWFQRETEEVPLVPVPANLKRDKKTGCLLRLDPLAKPIPGWQPLDRDMLPLWRRGRESGESIDGYLSAEGLRLFLEGGVPPQSEVVAANDLYSFEDRTGIGVDDITGTAREGQIYGVRMLSLRNNVRIVCEVEGPENTLMPLRDAVRLMRLGGEGRQVRVHAVQRSLRWPVVPPDNGSRRLILLISPAGFGSWRPHGLHPVSAAVPGYMGVSGWDLARRGPKPNRFMVPAGAVYFLAPGDRPPPDGLVAPDDERVGWGAFLEGNWLHA